MLYVRFYSVGGQISGLTQLLFHCLTLYCTFLDSVCTNIPAKIFKYSPDQLNFCSQNLNIASLMLKLKQQQQQSSMEKQNWISMQTSFSSLKSLLAILNTVLFQVNDSLFFHHQLLQTKYLHTFFLKSLKFKILQKLITKNKLTAVTLTTISQATLIQAILNLYHQPVDQGYQINYS